MKQWKNVMLVLGCAPNKDGRPSDPMISRVRKAVQLYRKNRYSKVLLSGGPTRMPVPESEVMRIMLLNFIPDKRMFAEKNSKDTIQNAVFCWEILKEKQTKNITVVTSAHHIPRTRYIFESLYGHMGVKLKFEPAQDNFDPITATLFKLKEKFLLARLKMKGFS